MCNGCILLCLAVLLATGLVAQAAPGDNRVAPDRRSGTVVLRLLDDLHRTYGFTTGDYGLTQGRTGIHNENSQIVATTVPGVGDELNVNWQPGEVARVRDVGPLPTTAGGPLFDRINVHEVHQRLSARTALVKRLPVVQDHVYLMAIDGPIKAERFALPGDPLCVKLQVVAHEPGKSVTLRWQILNEPFDVGRLPRLDPVVGTTAPEQAEIDRLLAQVAGADGDDAYAALAALGHKVLPAAVNLLNSLDRNLEADSQAAWRIDKLLTLLTKGRAASMVKGLSAAQLLEQHRTMVRYWYAIARQAGTAEGWQAMVARQQRWR